jgi:predicted methyltransferase
MRFNPKETKTMSDFWTLIEEFDPRTAEPHLCSALLTMEEQRYIRIRNGKIIPTEKGLEVSPQSILDRAVTRFDGNLSQCILVMEADGLLTIDNGNLTLTDKGIREAQEPD